MSSALAREFYKGYKGNYESDRDVAKRCLFNRFTNRDITTKKKHLQHPTRVLKTRRTDRRGLEHVHQASPHFIAFHPQFHPSHHDVYMVSTKELDIQTDGPHEQVDVAQALPAHIFRQRLADGDGLHHALLDADDESLLLVRAGTYTHRCEELPDVDVICCGDAGVGGEDVG
jgi:hypothetical protein